MRWGLRPRRSDRPPQLRLDRTAEGCAARAWGACRGKSPSTLHPQRVLCNGTKLRRSCGIAERAPDTSRGKDSEYFGGELPSSQLWEAPQFSRCLGGSLSWFSVDSTEVKNSGSEVRQHACLVCRSLTLPARAECPPRRVWAENEDSTLTSSRGS